MNSIDSSSKFISSKIFNSISSKSSSSKSSSNSNLSIKSNNLDHQNILISINSSKISNLNSNHQIIHSKNSNLKDLPVISNHSNHSNHSNLSNLSNHSNPHQIINSQSNLNQSQKRKPIHQNSQSNSNEIQNLQSNSNDIPIDNLLLNHHQPTNSIHSSLDSNLSPDEFLDESDSTHPSKKFTSEKRKAQNRAAQRNFRERKQNQSKQIESNLLIKTNENKKLKDLIKSLESENSFLRQHVSQSVIQEIDNLFIKRPKLDSIISNLNSINPSSNQKINHTTNITEAEEHARAATALSSLAAAPIDSVFDPQLETLTSTLTSHSNHSILNLNLTHPSSSSNNNNNNLSTIPQNLSNHLQFSSNSNHQSEKDIHHPIITQDDLPHVWDNFWKIESINQNPSQDQITKIPQELIHNNNQIENTTYSDHQSQNQIIQNLNPINNLINLSELTQEEKNNSIEFLSTQEAWDLVMKNSSSKKIDLKEISLKIYQKSKKFNGKIVISKTEIDKIL